MNKILTLAILVGLSGTSLVAAPPAELNLGALPADLQAKIKSAEEKATAAPNPLEQYISDIKTNVAKVQDEVNKLIADNPYLKDNDLVKTYTNIINSRIETINNTLNLVTNGSKTIQSDAFVIDNISEALSNQTFPYACATYNKGQQKQGYILRMIGSRNFALYPTQNNEDKNFTPIWNMVGTIGKASTSPFAVSSRVNRKVKALVGQDGKGNPIVYCLGD